MELIEQYEKMIDVRMKLKDIVEHFEKENLNPPEKCHKMVAIVNNKIFSTITMEEYDKLTQFTAEHCGVGPHVMSMCKTLSYNSLLIEWYIPITAISHMVEISKSNVDNFVKETFVYLKISSTVIYDHRRNVS